MYLLPNLIFIVLACSVQQALGGEIINGKEVKANSWKFVASVQKNGEHKCGGFLIQKNIVLTAAHCDFEGDMTVVLGTNDLGKVNERAMRYSVKKKCKHAGYKGPLFGNDIMMLTLSKSPKIKAIKLPNKMKKMKDGTQCRVAGWGGNKTRGPAVNKLRAVQVSTINQRTCHQQWGKVRKTLPANTICAGGYETKNGACQGDSGGPLVCNEMAVGIVSFNLNGNCNYPNLPNVYTEISTFLAWINDPKKRC